MNHKFQEEFKRIIIRPLSLEGAEQLRLMRNQPHIRQWFNDSNEISSEQQQKWYANYLNDPTQFMFETVLKESPDEIVGFVGLYNYNAVTGHIEQGRKIVDSRRTTERGLGHEMDMASIKIAFEHLNVQCLSGEVMSDNIRAIKNVLTAGLVIYGIKMGGVERLCS